MSRRWVMLTPAELLIARQVGLMRALTHRNDPKQSREDGIHIHQEGVAGELAFAKAVNCYPHLDPTFRPLAHDCTLRDLRVDVKTMSRHDSRMLVPTSHERSAVEVYVLLTGRAPHFQIVGAALPPDVFRAEYLAELKEDNPTYAVPQDTLTSVADAVLAAKAARKDR